MARVVDRKTFLTLPPGTIYAKGVKWAFDGLAIKGESLENDWYYVQPAWVDADDSEEALDRLEAMLEHGHSYSIETAEGRDGYFDADAVFLVLEQSDLKILSGWVTAALRPAVPKPGFG